MICAVCGDEFHNDGTQCAFCHKFIDRKCHGGTVGDGYVVCKACIGKVFQNFYYIYIYIYK